MIDKHFKQKLLDEAVECYCDEISDDSVVDGIPWKELKNRVIGSEEYKKEAWFDSLTVQDKNKLASLIKA